MKEFNSFCTPWYKTFAFSLELVETKLRTAGLLVSVCPSCVWTDVGVTQCAIRRFVGCVIAFDNDAFSQMCIYGTGIGLYMDIISSENCRQSLSAGCHKLKKKL